MPQAAHGSRTGALASLAAALSTQASTAYLYVRHTACLLQCRGRHQQQATPTYALTQASEKQRFRRDSHSFGTHLSAISRIWSSSVSGGCTEPPLSTFTVIMLSMLSMMPTESPAGST